MTKMFTIFTSFLATVLFVTTSCKTPERPDEVQPIPRDTIVKVTQLDGKRQYIGPMDSGWILPVDIKTNRQLTFTPLLNEKYVVKFQRDSMGGRPVVLKARKGIIDINELDSGRFELTFLDTINELELAVDFRDRTGYWVVRGRDKETGLLKEHITTLDTIYPFGSITYTTEK
jgi:hypothetical protein